MNRRNFLQTMSAGGAAAVIAPSLGIGASFATLATTGCSTATLESYLNVVLDSAEDILSVSSATDSWYSTLTAAITALKATESDWSGTTAVDAVVSALDAVDAVLAAIPVTSVYSPLIDLLTTALEAILTEFVSTSAVKMGIALHATASDSTRTKVRAILASGNPHRGRIPMRAPTKLENPVSAYKKQWNDLATGLNMSSKVKL